jgi:hypothetical protein
MVAYFDTAFCFENGHYIPYPFPEWPQEAH